MAPGNGGQDIVDNDRRGEGLAAVEADAGGDAAVGLEPGLGDIEIRAVDALDFPRRVLLEDFGDGTW
jgi:hypothetical protein